MASDASETDSVARYDLSCTDCSFEATVEGGFGDALETADEHQDGSGAAAEHFVDVELRDRGSITDASE